MKKIVTYLFVAGALIYGVQLLIFHDPNTTFFYLLQDFAFLPISVALATIVVGELLGSKEKRERKEKTQMLTSAFFTELGNQLMFKLLDVSEGTDEVREAMSNVEIIDRKSLDEIQKTLQSINTKIRLTESDYTELKGMIREKHESLLIISSNPLLLDHENFTKLLWGIFHLEDEFRLRGEYAEMSKADVAHIEVDFSETLKLLLINWTSNVLYVKTYYPNYYNAALGKLKVRG